MTFYIAYFILTVIGELCSAAVFSVRVVDPALVGADVGGVDTGDGEPQEPRGLSVDADTFAREQLLIVTEPGGKTK